MDYKKIVGEAWHFTQDRKEYIFWYGAIPAFFSTVFGIGYILYQYFSFLASPLFENWPRSFASVFIQETALYFEKNPGWLVPAIVALIIGLFGYFILAIFCEGALIQSVTRRRNGQEVRLRHGLKFGLQYFLQLFEYKLLIRTVSFWSILALLATVLRNFGAQTLGFLIPVLIITLLVAIALSVLMAFSEYYLIIDGAGVFESIGKSMVLVVRHLEETLLLIVLMIFIGARILIQILFVFLIPVVAVGIIYVFTLINLPGLAWVLAGIISTIGLIMASYLNGTINVFAVSVWTFTFLELTKMAEMGTRDAIVEGQVVKWESETKESDGQNTENQ